MKKHIKTFLIIGMSALMLLTFTTCSDKDSNDPSNPSGNPFIGTWKGSMTIKGDLTFTEPEEIEFTSNDYHIKSYTMDGTYVLDGNTAIMELDGKKSAGTAKVDGNTLNLNLKDSYGVTFTGTFAKVGGSNGGDGGDDVDSNSVHSRYRGTYFGENIFGNGRIVEISATQLIYMDGSYNLIVSQPFSNMRTSGGREYGGTYWDYIYNGDTKFGIVVYRDSPRIIMCSMSRSAKNNESEYKDIDPSIVLSDITSLSCDFDGKQY